MRKTASDSTRRKQYVLGAARLLYVIDYLGRYCSECHFDGHEEPWFMDLHHIDPRTKEYDVKNKIMHRNFSTVKQEVDKCQLLCGRCHRRFHASADKFQNHNTEIYQKLDELKRKGGVLHAPCRRFSLDEISALSSFVEQGRTIKEISILMNRDYGTIKVKLRELGLKASRERKTINVEAMLSMFSANKSLREIGTTLGVSYMTVGNRLRELGYITTDLHHDAVVRENKRRCRAT